jgi:FSR family fosmidomycin resistance protein-like MFS transporter
MGAGVDRRAMADVSLGHLAADLAQGALPALLVFLKPALHLTYTMTAAVVLVATATSSLAQPFFGHWSDRRRVIWLMPAGVALGGVGIALAAVAPDYELVLVLIGLSGLGIGAFHPEGMKIAAHASSARRASGMALFATGGNVGFALGPLLANGAVGPLGLDGGLFLIVPGALVAVLLLVEQGHLAHVRGTRAGAIAAGEAVDRPGAFKRLLTVIALRSVAYYGLFTFVPLWEVAHGHSKGYGAAMLSLVLLGGAIGTLCSGPLADRYGDKLVLAGALALTPGLLVVFALSNGAIAVIAVTLAGALIVSGFGLTTFMGQEYLPSRIATASGLTVGLTMGLGGIAAVLLGVVADSINLRGAFLVTAAAPAVGAVVALFLPRERSHHTQPVHVT